MEMGGYTQADQGRLLDSRQRASDILARKRPPTMTMAWKLRREWSIPAGALIAPPRQRGRNSAAWTVKRRMPRLEGHRGEEADAEARRPPRAPHFYNCR
jgi:hypothetical protein